MKEGKSFEISKLTQTPFCGQFKRPVAHYFIVFHRLSRNYILSILGRHLWYHTRNYVPMSLNPGKALHNYVLFLNSLVALANNLQ
jgi:hypothetical protein